MSGMCTESYEQVQPIPQHSTVPPIATRSTLQSVEDKPFQGNSTILSIGSGTQQTNIANIAPDYAVDQKISPDFGSGDLFRPKQVQPTLGGRSDGNRKKIAESTSCVLGNFAAGQTQKTDECTNEQALNLDQMSFANCGTEPTQEEQKFQVAATLLEFSSCNTVATHTPDLDFSCGSMSYSSGTCSSNLGDREGEPRRVGLNDTAPAVKPSQVSGPHAAVGGGSKSSLWSSANSLDLFKVEEDRCMGAELGDSIMTMQMGSLNDSMMDMSSVSGEKDPFGRLLSSHQYDSDRTVWASNKRKITNDSLSDLLNGSLDFGDSGQEGKLESSASTCSQVARRGSDTTVTASNKHKNIDGSLSDLLNGSLEFNDSGLEGKLETSAPSTYSHVARRSSDITVLASNKQGKSIDDSLSALLDSSLDFNDSGQEGKLETSASSTFSQVSRQQLVKCGNGTNKAKTNANQRSHLDDIFHSSESSDETTVSHMSVSAGVG